MNQPPNAPLPMQKAGSVLNVVAVVLLAVITFQVTWGPELPVASRRTSLCDEFTVRKLFFSQVLNSADMSTVAEKVREAASDSAMRALILEGSNLDPNATRWFRSDAEPGKCQAELKLQRPNDEGNSRAYIDYQVESFVPAGSSRFASDNVLYSVSASAIGARWMKDDKSAAPTRSSSSSQPTGITHTVRMVGDGYGYRYEPAEITINAGDAVTFVMVSGYPHNVAFDPDALTGEARMALAANMSEQAGMLSGKMLLAENEEYTISFAGVPSGTYEYHCTPHLAMNMRGRITVR